MKKAKKVILIVILIPVIAVFGSIALFYFIKVCPINDHLVDTMYVDSPEGLRLRYSPGLGSSTICVLPHRFPVKVVDASNEVTIDNTTAPWFQIVVPRYQWSGDYPEYGWVFGGYLNENQPDFIIPETARQLERYLSFSHWWVNGTPYEFQFKQSGEYWRGVPGSGIGETGKWKALTDNKIELLCNFIMEENEINETSELYVQVIDEYTFKINSDIHLSGFGKNDTYFVEGYEDSSILGSEYLYSKDSFGKTILEQSNICDEFIPYAIAAGVSAEGTKYEQMYHDYWSPIIKNGQRSYYINFLIDSIYALFN